jgi:hypothetical protein
MLGKNASAEAATVYHPVTPLGAIFPPPFQGTSLDA